jgi:ferric-dicitrate binding protein FerR (iron transport regulator)
MKRPSAKEVDALVALAEGRLSGKRKQELSARVENEPHLATAFARLKNARAALTEIAEEQPPEVSWRQIEAQVHWQLAQSEDTTRRGPLLRFAMVAVVLLVGAALGVVIDRVALDASGKNGSPQTLVQLIPTPILSIPVDVSTQGGNNEIAALAMAITGDVKVLPAGGSITRLTLNRPVLPGERVMTGRDSRVALQWQDKTGGLLSAESEIEVATLRQKMQLFTLWNGQVLFQVKKQPKDLPEHLRRRFVVNAHNLQVRVVGTQFSVRVQQGVSEVEVYKGEIEAWMRDPKTGKVYGEPISVKAGFRLRVGHEKAAKPLLSALPRSARERARKTQIHLGPWKSLHEVLADTGLLDIISKPAGADLRFDSRNLGRTNLRIRGRRGRHLIELWRHGKLQKRRWVEIKGHGLPQQVRTNLRPKAAPIARLDGGIADQFRRHAPLIRACYERQLKRHPGLSGKLVLRVSIAENGSVTKVGIDRNTLAKNGTSKVGATRVATCARAVISRWRFPAGNSAEVVYPFLFRAQ